MVLRMIKPTLEYELFLGPQCYTYPNLCISMDRHKLATYCMSEIHCLIMMYTSQYCWYM